MSIIKHVTLQKIVAHDFRYDPRICVYFNARTFCISNGKTNDFGPNGSRHSWNVILLEPFRHAVSIC